MGVADKYQTRGTEENMWSSLWEGVCHWSDARCCVGLAP